MADQVAYWTVCPCVPCSTLSYVIKTSKMQCHVNATIHTLAIKMGAFRSVLSIQMAQHGMEVLAMSNIKYFKAHSHTHIINSRKLHYFCALLINFMLYTNLRPPLYRNTFGSRVTKVHISLALCINIPHLPGK